MTVVADKYRGKQIYHIIYSELITAARYRGTVTYQEIAKLMGLPLTGNYMGFEVGYILGEISEDEHTQGRPMLSAVAVGASENPGPGFYTLAGQLNKFNGDSPEAKQQFWEQERDEVYKTWKKPLTDEESKGLAR